MPAVKRKGSARGREPISAGCSAPNVSLRDYFAGQAMIGMLAARNGFLVDCGIQNVPGWAYQLADAMLAERGKK